PVGSAGRITAAGACYGEECSSTQGQEKLAQSGEFVPGFHAVSPVSSTTRTIVCPHARRAPEPCSRDKMPTTLPLGHEARIESEDIRKTAACGEEGIR